MAFPPMAARARTLMPIVAATLLAACGGEPAAQPPERALPLEAAAAPGGGAAPPRARGSAPGGGATPARSPRLRVGYGRGSTDAPVSVLEFSDFGCPYCGLFAREVYPELHREFVETGQVHWTYVPFVLGGFPNGEEAARAAECAAEAGEEAFWEMHDRLYARQREWKSARDPEAHFGALAAEIGIDGTRFASCYRENRPRRRIDVANTAARLRGVRATPTFFVNGARIQGALPAEQFRLLIREALQRP